MTTWNAPEIEVTIGERTAIGNVIEMEVAAARNQPVASVYLELSNIRFEWQDDANDGDVLIVKWGWRGQDLVPLFTGTVLRSHLRETMQVWGLCLCRSLMDTRVTRTYQNEEAKAVVRHLLSGLNFASLDIDDRVDLIDKLPLQDNTIIDALDWLNRRLMLNHAFWCDAQGNFHWDSRDFDQEPAFTFTHSQDISEWKALPGKRFLLGVTALPVWHSEMISVVDREGKSKKYFVEQVRHTVGRNSEGEGARSRLWLLEVE